MQRYGPYPLQLRQFGPKGLGLQDPLGLTPPAGGGVLPLSAFSPSNVLYIPHKGGDLVMPEHTMEGYATSFAAGARVIDLDVHALSDGVLVDMHDATVTRTTTSTGNVVDLDTAGWAALNIDAFAQMGVLTDTVKPPFVEDVIGIYANRAIIIAEIKTSTVKQTLIDALVNAGVGTDMALICSTSVTDLAPAITVGYPALYLATGTTNLASAQSAGVTWVGLSETESDATIDTWFDAGFKVGVYTVTRRWRRDQLLALGQVSAIWSSDSRYTSRSTPARSGDDYASLVWNIGMLSSLGDTGLTEQARGRFYNTDGWGWNDQLGAFVTQGYISPIKGDEASRSYVLETDVQFNADTAIDRWAAFWVAPSDRLYNDAGAATENGYLVLIRKNGNIQIYKRTAGAAVSLVNKSTGVSAISTGATVRYRLTVTATGIACDRLNSDGSVNYGTGEAADTAHGCGNVAFGHNALRCVFSNVTVA